MALSEYWGEVTGSREVDQWVQGSIEVIKGQTKVKDRSLVVEW